MHPRHLPTPKTEYDRYLLHVNKPVDAQYTTYIRTLIDPLIARMPKGANGLDHGCGPIGVVDVELGHEEYPINSFDPFFKNSLQSGMTSFSV